MSLLSEMNPKTGDEQAKNLWPQAMTSNVTGNSQPNSILRQLLTNSKPLYAQSTDNWIDNWINNLEKHQAQQAAYQSAMKDWEQITTTNNVPSLFNSNYEHYHSPTGGGMRGYDKRWGDGYYGAGRHSAERGYYEHEGVDFVGSGNIRSPFKNGGNLEVLKYGYNGKVRITQSINGKTYSTVISHIDVGPFLQNGKIDGNTVIGTISDLNPIYSGITNHAHVELYEEVYDGGKYIKSNRLDPSAYIPVMW
jgi:hypothetical protein